jgi:serine/threonine protein kinase
MLKTFEDRRRENDSLPQASNRELSHHIFHENTILDISKLPYTLIPPSEKVDVWSFGIFIYQLCSGGNLFHTGYQGELRGVDAYSQLHHWNKLEADRNIREHIQDPLAQDLLHKILVPVNERLPNMVAVLKHPFFSPTSAEAERIIEKVSVLSLSSKIQSSVFSCSFPLFLLL